MKNFTPTNNMLVEAFSKAGFDTPESKGEDLANMFPGFVNRDVDSIRERIYGHYALFAGAFSDVYNDYVRVTHWRLVYVLEIRPPRRGEQPLQGNVLDLLMEKNTGIVEEIRKAFTLTDMDSWDFDTDEQYREFSLRQTLMFKNG